MALGLAFCDISTGEFRTSFFHLTGEIFSQELAHIDPKEILIPDQDADSLLA